MNLSFLPATLPLWAKLAVPVAMIVLPGGFLIPAVWLAIDRKPDRRDQESTRQHDHRDRNRELRPQRQRGGEEGQVHVSLLIVVVAAAGGVRGPP